MVGYWDVVVVGRAVVGREVFRRYGHLVEILHEEMISYEILSRETQRGSGRMLSCCLNYISVMKDVPVRMDVMTRCQILVQKEGVCSMVCNIQFYVVLEFEGTLNYGSINQLHPMPGILTYRYSVCFNVGLIDCQVGCRLARANLRGIIYSHGQA